MKIKLALIPSKHAGRAQDAATRLQGAMEAGEMHAVDQLAEELISLTDSRYSLSLTESDWHLLIEKIRDYDDGFRSDYIMDRQQIEKIVAAGLPELFANVSGIVEEASRTDGVVLQLPFEDEDADV